MLLVPVCPRIIRTMEEMQLMPEMLSKVLREREKLYFFLPFSLCFSPLNSEVDVEVVEM